VADISRSGKKVIMKLQKMIVFVKLHFDFVIRSEVQSLTEFEPKY